MIKIRTLFTKALPPVLAGITLALVAQGQPPPPPPSAPPPPPPVPDAADLTPEERSTALIAMGWAMGQSLGLDMDFSEDDVDLILEGMRAIALGEEAPGDMEELLPKAQALYMEKQQAKRQKEIEEAEELAKVNKAEAETYFAELDQKEGVEKTESGLRYEILEPGDSEKMPGPRDRIKITYTGRLLDGTVFDSNTDTENPTSMSLDRVIPGFTEGLQKIGVGGKIRLHVPEDLGYGSGPQRPGGKIQPGSTLVFEVELHDVAPPIAPPTPPRNRPMMPSTPPPGPPPGPPPSTPPPPPPADMTPPGPPPNITPPPPPNRRPTPPPPSEEASETPSAE